MRVKSFMQRRTVWSWIVLGVIAFLAGAAVDRYRWFAAREPEPPRTAGAGHQHSTYVCPMHPQVVSDQPGTCPICGMALVPARPAAEHAETSSVVQIAPDVLNNFGVRTIRVTRTTLVRRIETPGFVQQIEPAGHVRVKAPFDARVTALHFKSGQWLEQGQPLVTLSSETLRAAEQAHVDLLKQAVPASPDTASPAATPADRDMMLNPSRERLAQLGLLNEDITQLEQQRAPSSNLTLRAPYPGEVTRLQVARGYSVKAGAILFELSGLARATVLANAFQRDAIWIQTGESVEVRLPHVSNRAWPGVVNQGAVSMDVNSQNIGVRLSFSAPAHLLKSAMYVVATIQGDARPGALTVPQDALIRTEAGDRVVVALGGGRFQPVAVRTGIETGGQVEILSGLRAGQEVVVSAQFLIDSESSLQASFRRMSAH